MSQLSDEEIERIAEKAAEKAIEKLTGRIYQEVGKSIVSKFTYLIGAVTIGAYLWLRHKGIL